MSEGNPSKRARTNSTGASHTQNNVEESPFTNQETAKPDIEEIREKVKLLSQNQLTDIIVQAAQAHADVNGMIESLIQAMHEKEKNRVIDFDHYSKSVWKEINITYRSWSGSKQYDIAYRVLEDVNYDIKDIAKQCSRLANPKTRYNGLSVLRKIGKTIVLSSDTLAHEIRKNCQWDHTLENSMIQIVSAMKPEERKAIRDDQSSPEALWPKLMELKDLASGYCIFEKLGQVMDLLDGGKGI